MKPCTKDSAISWPLEEQSHTHSRTFLAFIIRFRSVIVCSALSEGHVTTKEKEANLKKKKKERRQKENKWGWLLPVESSVAHPPCRNCRKTASLQTLWWIYSECQRGDRSSHRQYVCDRDLHWAVTEQDRRKLCGSNYERKDNDHLCNVAFRKYWWADEKGVGMARYSGLVLVRYWSKFQD